MVGWKKREEERGYHRIASLFPLMDGAEFEELKSDIAQNGLLEPIYLHRDGSVLDGRNRHRACIETDTKPRFETWNGNGSPVQFVVSKNLHRRHLSSSQRAAISLDALEMLEEEARERQLATLKQGDDNPDREVIPEREDGRARDHAATMFQTNPRYVQDAKKLRDEAPDLLDEVKAGKRSLPQAKRVLKERQRQQHREENQQRVARAADPTKLTGIYSTIVLDPPWDWGDEGDVDQFGRARPRYQTWPIEKLMGLPVGKYADKDCHIYLWITNRSLPKGFQLLEAWGFRYITCLTWVKPHFGMGNYFRGQTEQVLFGVKGSQPLKRKDAPTVFHAPRGPHGHSSKPLEFYEFVESCSPGPYLEMFSRNERDGWVMWGEEGISGN